jgi:hypothetical protein
MWLTQCSPLQDGVPYIVSMQAGPAQGQLREEGYNLIAKSVFKDMADMKYYETECEGHQAFKVYLRENAPVQGLKSFYFTPSLSFEF